MTDAPAEDAPAALAVTAALVLAHYGITGADVTPLDIHGSSAMTLVVTQDGTQLMLKRIVASPALPGVLREQYTLLHHLADFGVPVAVPLITRAGDPFVELDGVVRVLTPRLSPRANGLPEGAVAWAGVGRAIAALHEALAASAVELAGWTMDFPRDLHDDVWPTLDASARHVGVLDLPADRAALAEAVTGFASHRLHGDLHGGNVLLDRVGVYAVVDFDELPMGPRVNDIGYYAADLVKNRAGLPDDVVDVVGWVVDGYRAAAGLDARTSAAVIAFMIVSELRLLAWFCGPDDDLTQWTKHRETLEWILEHRDALQAAVVSVE